MDYQALYEMKKTTAEDIASRIRSGSNICSDTACAIPPAIINALGERAIAGRVKDIHFHTMSDRQPYTALQPEAARGRWIFTARSARKASGPGIFPEPADRQIMYEARPSQREERVSLHFHPPHITGKSAGSSRP